MPEFIPSAALVVLTQVPELQVLLVRRSPTQRTYPNHWTFPGGKCNPTDGSLEDIASFKACALRECTEEIGVDLSQHTLWDLGWRVTPPFAPQRFETRYFCTILTAPCRDFQLSGELAEARWWKPCEILQSWQKGELFMPPPVRGIVAVLAKQGLQLPALAQLANDREQLYEDLQLHPGLEVIPLRTPTLPPATHTNCILMGHERFLIVDPASPYPDQQALLLQRIQNRQKQGHRPLAIVLSHHHRDHIGGVAALQSALGVPIQAHPETFRRIPQPLRQTEAVFDQYRWDLGLDPWTEQAWQIEALHTPGHAAGHLCLLDLRQRVAYVGDMLAGIGTILIESPPEGNMQQYLDSLQRLEQCDLYLALPAHGPLIYAPSALCQHYRKHRLKREQQIIQALETCQSEEALLPQVYSDVSPQLWPLARKTLQAHLYKLLQEQRIKQLDTGQWQLVRTDLL